MSDTPPEGRIDSETNLIKVHHVGVTAKLQSPLKNLMNNYCSSTETEGAQLLYNGDQRQSNTKYIKLNNEKLNMETDSASTTTDQSKILYEMRAVRDIEIGMKRKSQKLTPSKIEFQLYKKKTPVKRKTVGHSKCNRIGKNKKKSQRCLFTKDIKRKRDVETSIFKRLRQSLKQLSLNSKMERPSVDKIFDEFPEPATVKPSPTNQPLKEIRIGIYPFDHGCVEYLKTHDAPPQIISIYLAERAVYYATRFWGEFFGSIHIGVAFMVTFVLQSYRFLLYSLINTLLVGFLHMTSDYLIKPLLTVIFNGFLQPVMIFCLNILASMRDILKPVAETIDNFMKPVATVGKSIRLIHASYNKRNMAKNV